ncbi:MAG: hypothetical protein GY876_05450 [Planctomycetes bacterium]|nr:hypothetical protein [Planctomycetota bacterium]
MRILIAAACCYLAGCGDGEAPKTFDPHHHPDVVSLHNEAVAAMGAYDYDTALRVLNDLTVAHPTWREAQIDHAIAQLNRQSVGDDGKALDRLARVLADDPTNVRAHFVAGILRLHAGQIEEAKQHFEVVTSRDASDAYAAYYLGQALMQLGDIEASVPWFTLAVELDPYFRSAYYAGAQAARRVGQSEQASAWLDVFQRLEHNPRAHLAEIKYTRMGPKAEVKAIPSGVSEVHDRPSGEVFDLSNLEFSGAGGGGAVSLGWESIGRSQCIDSEPGSGKVRRYVFSGDGEALPAEPQPLDSVKAVSAALWGDVDSDGVLDVVLARNGVNELWLGSQSGEFAVDDRFGTTGVSKPQDTVDAALFDADHDGDLDVFFVNRNGPHTLMNNNGDGTWRSLTDDSGFPGGGANRVGRGVLVADFDGDLDQDIVVVYETGPHEVWINDRLWKWHSAGPEWAQFLGGDIAAAVAADIDADGDVEIVAIDSAYAVNVWDRGRAGWRRRELAGIASSPPTIESPRDQVSPPLGPRLAVVDVTGDGQLDVIAETGAVRPGDGAPVIRILNARGESLQEFAVPHSWTLLQRADGRGPSLIGMADSGPVVVPPGTGRFRFVDAILRGRTAPGESMRSNTSGIGSTIAARVGTRWTLMPGVRDTAGPGQSLQPSSIGIGGAEHVDFISVDWTDGVFQTESRLEPGPLHEVVETQRQLSSCPLIFAWDGSKMSFLTDCLGVGGIGFLLTPDSVAEPRPRERVLLSQRDVAPRDGRFEIVLAEPMQETCYLDSIALECVDIPAGWEVLPDERMGTSSPQPTSALLFSRRSVMPIEATTSGSGSVLDAIGTLDGVAVDPGPIDVRFIGRVVKPYVLELEFGQGLSELDGTPVLVLDAWVEYPYSQTMFAAWQANRGYAPLSIEARCSDGSWQMLHPDIGYPAGMPRRSIYPLQGLPDCASRIRLTTDLELYVDFARVAMIESCESAVVRRLEVSDANLGSPGYPKRRALPQRYPSFVWSDRQPFWDVRNQRGRYTQFGPVGDLVGARDGQVAVFGAGEAIRCVFDAPGSPPPGFSRQLVLDLHGWCKDMDLLTRGGEQVEPIPGDGAPRRTRHRSGR